MYEGRTRGKKLKYTYSDEEDIFEDEGPSRRSARNTSNIVTPAEPSRPRFTASGRQIRSRAGGLYGASLLTGQREDTEDDEEDNTRPQRSRTATHPNGYSGYGLDDLDDDADASSTGNESANDWKGGDDDENEMEGDNEAEDASGDESIVNGELPSLVVQLRYGKGKATDKPPPAEAAQQYKMSAVEIPTIPSAPVSQPRPSYAPETMLNPSEPAQPLPATTAPSPIPPAPVPQQAPSAAPAVSFAADHEATVPQKSEGAPTVPSISNAPLSAPAEPNGSIGPNYGAGGQPGAQLPQTQSHQS